METSLVEWAARSIPKYEWIQMKEEPFCGGIRLEELTGFMDPA